MLRVTGPAPPELAWTRYAEIGRWPQWSPQIRRVDGSAERIAPGVHGRVHGPFGVGASFTVLEVDEAAGTWTWRVTLGAIVVVLRHAVLPAPGGGTTNTLDLRAPPPVVVGYAPVARLALRRLVAP